MSPRLKALCIGQGTSIEKQVSRSHARQRQLEAKILTMGTVCSYGVKNHLLNSMQRSTCNQPLVELNPVSHIGIRFQHLYSC